MKSFLLCLTVFISFMFLAGCGNNQTGSSSSKNTKEGTDVRVVKQMGEMLSDTLSYLPLIGSLAESGADGEEGNVFLIIGKDLENGDNLSVQKLSKLVFTHGNDLHRVIISVPNDKKYQSIEVKNFEDFATRYGSIKFQLENWYNHFAGLGNCRFVRWEMINN